tara:strand:- start:127 stop:834 length:708 start_codon:yes stop_codon:yes gene_type:complete
MATTSATLTLASSDMLTDNLSFSTTSVLTKAGTATGISNTTGLARKTTTSTDQYTLFYADDYTAAGAHKLYVRNIETAAGLFFTITVDDTVLGRIYANDWILLPWSATDGTKGAFTVTFANTFATGDTAVFDGVTNTCGATETPAGMVDIVAAAKYPNWTAAETASTVVTFTSKSSNYLGLIETGAASDDFVVTTAGDGTGTIARTVTAVPNASDIKITPSSSASHTLEYMLLYE